MELKLCRYCKIRDIDPNNKESYILPQKGWYYHPHCYEKKIKNNAIKSKNTIRQCYYCKQKFDIDQCEWVMPRHNKYAHLKCYEKYYTPDEAYIDKIYRFLKEEVGMTYDYQACERQRRQFIEKNGYTNEGIYNALKYHYLVKRGSVERSGNRIGIVGYVYNEAQDYYSNLKKKQKEIANLVNQQKNQTHKIIEITQSFNKDKRQYIDLDNIALDEVID